MKRFLLVLFCALAPILAQTPVSISNPCLQQACFFATTSATVAASGTTTLTLQQPATGYKAVNLMGAVIQCPGQSFSVDQSQNGTAATTTAGSAVAMMPYFGANNTTVPVASALVYTASNAGAGTAVAPTLTYPSAAIAVVDLSQRVMNIAGAAVNYSVKLTNTGSGNCTGTVSIYWSERQ